MRVPKGKEQIGEFNGVPLVIDWGDLLRYRGRMRQKDSVDNSLGNILRILSWFMIVGGVVWGLFLSDPLALGILPASTFPELLFWAGLGVNIYGRYLRRDKNIFAFNLEHLALSKELELLSKGERKEIEVDSFISYPILATIDQSFFVHHDSFVDEMIAQVVDSPKVMKLTGRLGLDPNQFKNEVIENAKLINTSFDVHYKGLFVSAFNKAIEIESEEIDHLVFFFVFARHLWEELLKKNDIGQNELEAVETWVTSMNRLSRYRHLWKQLSFLKPTGTVNRAYTSRYAATVETYGEDYTKQAAQGEFELSMGRDAEMEQLINILQRPDGIAGLIVGPPGVGKSHFLKHLAVRMVVEDVPAELQDKRLVVFDFNKAFTDAANLDDFRAILQRAFDELMQTKDIIIVLDEVEQLLNVREDYQAEISSILENGIRNSALQIIATTTVSDYRRYIGSNRGLTTLFEVVEMDEASPLTALQVLIDESTNLERKYQVQIQVKALEQIVKLAPQFDADRVMPDKAIDLLEQALVESVNRGEKFLTSEVIDRVVSRKVGVNVGAISDQEAQKLDRIEEVLHQRVVGQDKAVKAVAAALRRSRVGFNKDNQPIAAFLFFGPTGVGKTEVARTLAATYYGDEKMLTRIDMSEFQEEQNLERLIGKLDDAGEFIGGQLTEAVRSRPFSLVLLDELEKANPKVLDLFLQVLDEGTLTDGAGRKVSFANTIIVATSNAGSQQIARLLAQGRSYSQVYKQVLPELNNVYRVEFLNRFDKTIMFKPLNQIEVQKIAIKMIGKVVEQMIDKQIDLHIDENVVAELARLGYDPVFGARQLKRVIQENLEDKLAELIVTGQLKPGSEAILHSLENIEIK